MTERKVADLVGKNIVGVRAITTNPRYFYQYPDGVPVRTLIKAAYKQERGFKWLYLYWEKDSSTMFDCGYSGWREDCTYIPTIQIQDGGSNAITI